MMSSGAKPTFCVSRSYARVGRSRPCARRCRPGPARRTPSRRRPRRSGGTSAACSRNSSSPSLRLIEFTTALPWTQLQARPRSPTTSTSRSSPARARCRAPLATSRRKRDIAASRVEHRLVHVHVDQLRAVLDLLAGDLDGLLEPVLEDQLRELARAGDVGPLADVDEELPGRDRPAARGRDSRVLGSISGGLPRRQARAPPRRSPGCAPASCRSSRRRCSPARRRRTRRARGAIVSGVSS